MPLSGPQPPGVGSGARGRWVLLVAAGWLGAFSVWFYSLGLPNNPPITRPEFWTLVPGQLADLIDPPTAAAHVSSWSNVGQRFDAYVTAALIVMAAWGLGHLVLAALRPGLADVCAERTVFAFGAGIALLTLVTLGCGLAGWLSRPVLGSVIAAGIAGGLIVRARPLTRWCAERIAGRTRSVRSAGGSALRALKLACLVAIAPFLVAMLLGATLPPTDFDARAYHLVGPKEYFLNGRISFLAHNVYTSFPFLTEMISLAGMVLRDDWYRGALAGQAVLASFAPATALAIYAAGRRWFHPAAGWLGALGYLTTPWTYRISTIAYAEGGLSFFLFAALLALLIAAERRKAGEPSLRMFLLAGVLAGSAMACKYTGAVQVVIPLGVAAAVAAGRRPAAQASDDPGAAGRLRAATTAGYRFVIVFAAGILVAVGPWLLKNLVETGNPVYPLLYGVFGGRDWDAGLDERFRAGHSSRPGQYTPAHLAANLIDVAGRNDWHSAALFAFAPLALMADRRRALAGWLWLYVVSLFAAWWLLTHRIDRFWVPMLPVVALLAGAGATCCRHIAWKIAAGTVLAGGVLFNLAFISTALAGNNAWLADLGRLRQSSESLAPTIDILNEMYDTGALPPDAKILLVGDAQVFDARFPHVYNTVFDRSVFEQWFGERDPETEGGWRVADEQTIRERLASSGVTHVVVNWQELLRYRTTYGYSDFITPARFAALVEQGLLAPPELLSVSSAPREQLPASHRQELDRWAPELKIDTPEGPRYVTAELYPVRSGPQP